ncbi:MAG: ATP-binding protein [Gammaproteobacteria bacterium]
MTRWLPRTLSGRLMLTLLIGLLAAQLAAALILLRDRASVIYQASGFGAAQRIAGIVQVLDHLDPVSRADLLPAFNSPQLQVRLMAKAPTPEMTVSENRHAAHLRKLLRRLLGKATPVQVSVIGHVPRRGERHDFERHHPRFGPMAEYFPRRDIAFEVSARLQDGSWAKFEYNLGGEPFARPWQLLLTLAVLLISVIVLVLFAVRWLTRPLAVLATAADDLGRDMHRPPLPEKGPAEVRRAASAFNTMQARIRTYLHEREQMLAAVSHDLRTPITRLRLRAELITDTALREKIDNDLAEMEAMTAVALDFLRGAGSDEPVQQVDVIALLESLQADMEEAGDDVSLQEPAMATPYPARPLALKRLLTNLLDNAIKYGRRATIRIEDTPTQLRIVIADEGPGIAEDQLERVFEPFYRIEGSRNRKTGGVGLGLALARDIARAHGGDLVLRNRATGGLEAILSLPR